MTADASFDRHALLAASLRFAYGRSLDEDLGAFLARIEAPKGCDRKEGCDGRCGC